MLFNNCDIKDMKYINEYFISREIIVYLFCKNIEEAIVKVHSFFIFKVFCSIRMYFMQELFQINFLRDIILPSQGRLKNQKYLLKLFIC